MTDNFISELLLFSSLNSNCLNLKNRYYKTMFQIIAHVKPTEKSTHFAKYKGAYAVLFINYKDIDGAFELAKYYITEDDWEIIELEQEYLVIEDKEEMDENYSEYYDEIMDNGYSIVFNLYENDEE